jgi:DeoD family purine-nucleoside phosphorylase
MPIHLKAKTGDYAPTVLVVGDPGRAEDISRMLTKSRPVNMNRGLLGYTGEHAGHTLSVQTTGIGCPSAAIVVEELIELGVKRIIRVGTCGGIAEHIQALDYICALTATPDDGTTRTYLGGEPHAPWATFEILKMSADLALKSGLKIHYGGIVSVDVFYNPFPDYVPKFRKRGILAVEMETSLLYFLANRSKIQAASFLLVSDIVGGGEGFTKYVTEDDLKRGMDGLIKHVLEVCSTMDSGR